MKLLCSFRFKVQIYGFFRLRLQKYEFLSSPKPKRSYISRRKALFPHLCLIFADRIVPDMSLHRHSHNRSSRGIAIALIFAIGACCFSCANMGRPGGGPKDETPPVLKKSNPPMGALHYDKNKITLEFDEIVQIENPNEKIIISPPQTQMPQISALGRIVSITLNYSMNSN